MSGKETLVKLTIIDAANGARTPYSSTSRIVNNQTYFESHTHDDWLNLSSGLNSAKQFVEGYQAALANAGSP